MGSLMFYFVELAKETVLKIKSETMFFLVEQKKY